MLGLEQKVDALLRTKFGTKALAKMETSTAKEKRDERESLVSEVERLDAEWEARVDELHPQLVEAEKAKDELLEEFTKAANRYGFLRRRLTAGSGEHDRKTARLQSELRKTADPRIGEFTRHCRECEADIHSRGIMTDRRDTGRFGTWAPIFGLFSTEQSAKERAATCRAVRQEAEQLVYRADDIPAALKKLRDKLPSGTLEFNPTGQEMEVAQ